MIEQSNHNPEQLILSNSLQLSEEISLTNFNFEGRGSTLKEKFIQNMRKLRRLVSQNLTLSIEDLKLNFKSYEMRNIMKNEQENGGLFVSVKNKNILSSANNPEIIFDLSNVNDRALQLSYRMNKLRKERQIAYQQKKKNISRVDIKQTQREKYIGKIFKLPPINHIHQTSQSRTIIPEVSKALSRKKEERKKQTLILQKYLKKTKHYYTTKFLKNLFFELVDNVVRMVEKKRSFFSYKIRRKDNENIKFGANLKPRNKSRILSYSLTPVKISISPTRSRNKKINHLYDMTLGKSESSDSQESQESDEEESSENSSSSNENQQSQNEQSEQQENDESSESNED